MKTLFSIIGLLLANYCFAQNIYQIRADTVRIFNNCDTAELVLENRTKDTLGFLYNKGNGRTEFRRLQLQKVGASQLAITGQDTLDFQLSPDSGSTHYIQNQIAADQLADFRISGIGRSSSQFQVVKDGSDSLASAFQLFNAAGTRGANMQLDASANPNLSFWLQDGAVWKRRMTLTPAGKLGLGTANPLFGMHITGTPGCVILESTGPYSGGSGGFFEAFNRGVPSAANQRLGGLALGAMPDSLSLSPSIVIDGFSDTAWTNNVSHPSYLRVMTTPSGSIQPLERMRINANGNIGIATASPTEKLEVTGSILASGGMVKVKNNFTSGFLGFLGVGPNSSPAVGTPAPTFVIVVNNTTPQLWINTTGVGVGVLATSQKLEVAGNTRTQGFLTAVRVISADAGVTVSATDYTILLETPNAGTTQNIILPDPTVNANLGRTLEFIENSSDTWNLNYTVVNPGGPAFTVLPANTTTVLKAVNGSWYKVK